MAYVDHFRLADDLIIHFDETIRGVSDPFISSRYVGFVAVASVTAYELSIREIFIDFGERKHKILGNFTRKHLERINGRIRTSNLKDDYISRFGEKYVSRFKRNSDRLESRILKTRKLSVFASYNNVIQWRNEFSHQGRISSTVTYPEIVKSYELGKEIIHCLAGTMRL